MCASSRSSPGSGSCLSELELELELDFESELEFECEVGVEIEFGFEFGFDFDMEYDFECECECEFRVRLRVRFRVGVRVRDRDRIRVRVRRQLHCLPMLKKGFVSILMFPVTSNVCDFRHHFCPAVVSMAEYIRSFTTTSCHWLWQSRFLDTICFFSSSNSFPTFHQP